MEQSEGAERWKVVTDPRERRSAKRPLLGDHRRVGKRFVPPFVAMLGTLNPVKWIDDLLPEMLWLGMMNNDHGLRDGVQLAAALAKSADQAMAPHTQIFANCSAYWSIASDRWADVIRMIPTASFVELQRTLRPLAALYPRCPFSRLWSGDQPQPRDDDIGIMQAHVASMVNRGDRPAMLAQANAIYIACLTGKLIVNEGSMLSKLEAITEYPETEESRMAGSAVRAASLMLARQTDETQQPAKDWTRYFWQRGIEISSCDLGADDQDG